MCPKIDTGCPWNHLSSSEVPTKKSLITEEDKIIRIKSVEKQLDDEQTKNTINEILKMKKLDSELDYKDVI